jgi:hypothetical protein
MATHYYALEELKEQETDVGADVGLADLRLTNGKEAVLDAEGALNTGEITDVRKKLPATHTGASPAVRHL